jgi:antitoxin component YwqK of YwqJK toxin-antitoxin module
MGFEYKTAVIEIMIPMSYLPFKYYIQAVPLRCLDDKLVSVAKSDRTSKMISTRNVKLLKVFNGEDKEGIKAFIKEKREELGYDPVSYSPGIKITENLFKPRNLSGENNRYNKWNSEQPIVNGKHINQYDSEGNKDGYWEEIVLIFKHKGNYVNGRKNGVWKSYWPDGDIKDKIEYENGQKHGTSIVYDYDYLVKGKPYEIKKLFINGKFVKKGRDGSYQ